MPVYATPTGRADIGRTTTAIIDHLKQNCRGMRTLQTAAVIAQRFDIQVWQAHYCIDLARRELRLEDEVLCGKTGPGGGYFIAMTEEEARSYGLRRSETTLTHIENIIEDAETAVRGVVQSAPLMEPYWRRTRNRLQNISNQLTQVRLELTAAGAASSSRSDDGDS